MKIAVVETHWKSIVGKERTSAIDYFRSISPVTYAAKKRGWEVDIIRGLGKTPSVKEYSRLKEYDLVWLSYLDNSVALKYLIDTGTPYTMDFDDDLINIDATNPVSKQYTPDSSALRTLVWSLKHSPHITVSTNHLKKVYGSLRDLPITVLQNSVDLNDYQPKEKTPHDRIVIGYMGGITHYADVFHSPFWGAINYLIGKYPDRIAFKVLGMLPDLWWKDLPDFRYTSGTSDFVEYRQILSEWIRDVDIAVAPLHQTFFNRSKSHIKTQEYGIYSVPIVATKIEPYEDFNGKTDSIMLCEGHKDWVESLEKLINSKEERELWGKKSLARVKQISLEKRWDKWANYIESLKKPKLSHLASLPRVKSVLFSCMFFGNRTGSELYVYDLAKEYIKRGIRVGVWASHYGNEYIDEAENIGIKIHKYKPKEKYDIYHSQQVEPTERVLGLGRVIQTVHSEILDVEFPVTGVDKYIAVRPSVEAFVMTHSNRPVSTIFNGVDTDLFYKTEENNGKILFVGKEDYLRHDTIEDLRKTNKLFHFQGTQEEVARATRECDKTASIMLGRTTIEGWHCGKTGIVYEVDGMGKIKSKKELTPPIDLTPFTIPYMADRTLESYV